MESSGIFWGIILKPDKRYESVVEEDFRVTKACVDTTTLESGKVATVILEKGNEEFILCNLNGPSNYDSNIDLAFVAGEKICFKTEGSATVHLTGSLMPDDDVPDDSMMMDSMGNSMFDTTEDGEEVEEEESESDSEEEEAPQLVTAANGKRKLQDQNGVDSPKQSAKKAKKEEVKQAEAMKKILSKDKKKEDEDDESDDDDNDETMDADMDDLENEEEEESDDEDDGEEEESEVEQEEEAPTPKKETPKKDKKKKEKKPAENGDTPAKANGQAAAPPKKDTPAKPPKEEPALTPKAAKVAEGAAETPKSKKKDKKNKNKEKVAEGATPAKQPDAAKPASPTKTPKPQKMTLKGGIVAEDIRVGNGPEAKAGKHVGMYYKGTLTKSGKQFDAQLQGKPFKFKLGKGEVIKGWDVGVEGMKVGGKRKLTIPPHMAYGKDGAGPDIPPNASLTFEVECKMVN